MMETPLFGSIPLIGKAMVKHGLITEDQLEAVLVSQQQSKQRFGEAAVSLGIVTDEDLAKFIASFYHLPYRALDASEELDPAISEIISETMARRYGIIAVRKDADRVTLVMVDPSDVRAADAVRLETNCQILKAVGSRTAILKAIDRYYHAASRLAKSMDSLLAGQNGSQDGQIEAQSIESDGSDEGQANLEASDAPVIQFVNLLLMRAVQERASDIHVEPEENGVTVRLRVDSQLREMSAPPKHMLQGLTTRIKLLGNLDIAERRLPQDGRFKFRVFDKTIDIRVSCMPTIYGEKIVMRILDRASLILDMKELGFESEMLKIFQRTLSLPHGLVILTGPTGSGKTTTLYAALNSIKTPTKNIVTIEDPVEYQLGKINQIHVKPDIGLTFAAGLRSILRQDPDIIMLGEMRDNDTAEICIRAALTGHLVLSTLHTNDSIAAVMRLVDMGVEPYLLGATLNLVMSQRLVRRICEGCADTWKPPQELLDRLAKMVNGESKTWKFQMGRGCARCRNTGYRGRMAVYEQLLITDKIKQLIMEGATEAMIREVARKEGFKTLLQNALVKVQAGITTLEEAYSICGTQSEMLE